MKVKEVVSLIEKFAPKSIAESWDNVGLLIGNDEAMVKTVLVTLDVTDEVIDEAIEKKIDLIIAHHPNIFKGIKSLVSSNPFQQNYMRLIQHNISVYACHTNVDNAFGGMNDWISEAIGLSKVDVLVEQGLYEIDNIKVPYGTGKIGEYEKSISLENFIQIIKDNLETPHIKIVQSKNVDKIRKVALCGGAGSDFYMSAIQKGADVYLTGDVSYHIAQDMQKQGLTLIDIGHYAEVIFVEKICEIYENWIGKNQVDLKVIKSNVNTNPFR